MRIGVLNLMGRLELNSNLDSPFQAADRLLRGAPCDVVLVDFHAEATSEKGAMGWFLDGKVQAVWGTHTHVPTADCQLLPKGTGYVTDLGMTLTRLMVLHGDLSAAKNRWRPDQSDQLADRHGLHRPGPYPSVHPGVAEGGHRLRLLQLPRPGALNRGQGGAGSTVAPGEVSLGVRAPIARRRCGTFRWIATGEKAADAHCWRPFLWVPAGYLPLPPGGGAQGGHPESGLSLCPGGEKKFFDVQLQDATRLETGLWDRLGRTT